MGTNVSKVNLKRKTDFSDSPNQSKRFKAPATISNGCHRNLISFSWKKGFSSSVSLDGEGNPESKIEYFQNLYLYLIGISGLRESIGITDRDLNNAESASVSMIVNVDESEDVDVDIEAEIETEPGHA